MQPLLTERNHLYLSVAIITLGTFLGFLACSYILGIYQIRAYVHVSLYIFLFHIFWLTFLFDLHFKRRDVLINLRPNHTGWALLRHALVERTRHVFNWGYFRRYLNFFILPGLIYWSVIVLMFLNPFNRPIKLLIIIAATIALMVAYWFFKKTYTHQLEVHVNSLKILAVIKLFAAFLVYTAALGLVWYFGLGTHVLIVLTFFSTFWLLYQALFQHHLLSLRTLLLIIGISITVSMVSLWVYANWNSEYYTGGLVMLVFYNFLWGMLHHYMERTLTRKVLLEYFLINALVLIIVLSSHNFGPRIG